MAERLHYFTEVSTPVSFDCDDSEIDSDLEVDLSRRPVTDSDRAKIHARQLQLWSDEARRRRSGNLPAPQIASAHRRPSSASASDVFPHLTTVSPETRARISTDRQQSNLSERARNRARVSRSHSAKNLRIRITPSSSSKSLVSDIESELGHPTSVPQSPHVIPHLPDIKQLTDDKPLCTSPLPDREETHPVEHTKKPDLLVPSSFTLTTSSDSPTKTSNEPATEEAAPKLTRRMSFSRRVKRFSNIKRWLRR